MLTTTIDGLWVLQVLSRIEVLAPELGLRPYLPSVETPRLALAHPVAEELRDAGAISESGEVDATLLEWLTVLSPRDMALLIYVQTPMPTGLTERVLLARLAQWWVTLERCESIVRIAGAGVATSQPSAAMLISSQFERLCGAMAPAALRPVTVDAEELLATVTDGEGLQRFLADRNFDSDQIRTLALAADTKNSAQASFVALESGGLVPLSRNAGAPGVVTVIDTPAGRLLCECVCRGGRRWMIVGPGSARSIAAAVLKIMHCLPARDTWHSHRKAV